MSNKTPINIFYFDNPNIYEEVQSQKRRYLNESKFLIKILKKYSSGKYILDVGCGTAKHAKYFSALLEIVGVICGIFEKVLTIFKYWLTYF